MSSVRKSTLVDGYIWRKYGQKEVAGTKHPRSYYRCVHKPDRGCDATRQAQQTDDDPSLFDVAYYGEHTCLPLENTQLLKQLPQRSSVPLAVGIKAAKESVAASGNSSPGSSSMTNAATPESQITYKTLPSDGQQEDTWMDHPDYGISDNSSGSDFDQRPYGHGPQDEYKEGVSTAPAVEHFPTSPTKLPWQDAQEHEYYR